MAGGGRIRFIPLALMIGASVALLAGLTVNASAKPKRSTKPGFHIPHQLTNCLWRGPIGVDPSINSINIFYPDAGAFYFSAAFRLPVGQTLTLHGRYPHARYFSLTAYGPNAKGQDAPQIHDSEIVPDRRSTNPFRVGKNRDAKHRSYSFNIVAAPPPPLATRPPNTLYVGPPSPDPTVNGDDVLVLRVYGPDRDVDSTGGVGLPKPVVNTADGRILKKGAACAAIGSREDGRIASANQTTAQDWTEMRDAPGRPPTWPALNPGQWHTIYSNADFLCQTFTPGTCPPNPQRVASGPFASSDNDYISTFINRELGHVVVISGKMPTTPRTWNGNPKMGRGQVRYWSLCESEAPVTRITTGCLFDEQVPMKRKRRYTIAIALPSDRPSNAVSRCGFGFLPFSPAGDGVGDLDLARLSIREVLASPHYGHAIQNTKVPGDESQVMGPYLPSITYASTKAFEKRGCHAPAARSGRANK
jgi:hypothetical protein